MWELPSIVTHKPNDPQIKKAVDLLAIAILSIMAIGGAGVGLFAFVTWTTLTDALWICGLTFGVTAIMWLSFRADGTI